jgi:glucose-1-phosphate thymidylyltransferase
VLILGDNVFYGNGLLDVLRRAAQVDGGGLIFGCRVKDPERFGVVEFDEFGKILSIEEKPVRPKSNYAVPGLYFFDNEVIDIASRLKPSARGEFEIADVIQEYLRRGELRLELFDRDFIWLDTGTHESLLEASVFVERVERREGLKVACIEEVAYRMRYIDAERIRRLAQPLRKNGYGRNLLQLISEDALLKEGLTARM